MEYTQLMPRIRDYLLPSLFAFACGAIIGVYTNYALMFGLIIGTSVLIVLPRIFKGNYPLTRILFIALFVFVLGVFRGAALHDQFDCSLLCAKVNTLVSVVGVVDREPEFRDGSERFVVRLTEANDIRVQANIQHAPSLSYGTEVRLTGILREPEDFEGITGALFRYKDFLHARGIMYVMNNARVESLRYDQGNSVIGLLLSFKQKIKEICDRLPSPESGLLMGMIFGGKNGLPANIQDDFRIAGIIHIVVLSGENLTIIALLVMWVIRKFLGFYTGIMVSAFVISLYAIIGGMEPATMRALVIVLLVFVATLLRREVSLPRILFIGAMLLIVYNPLLLFDDPSFQLSVLAMLGLIFIGPIIERSLLTRGIPLLFTSYLAPIFAAQLGVLPYIMYTSQSFASYAFLANALVLFIIGFLSIGGMVVVAIGWVLPSLLSIIAFPVVIALSAVLHIAHGIAQLPYAALPLHISGWFTATVYLFVSVWIFRRYHDGTLTPLALFTLKEEVKQIAKRKIPWAPPIPDVQGIQFNHLDFVFVAEQRKEKVDTERTICWDD
ncbi:MAG TPA: ComEC/Rec2 family competence protein [Candidatus Paceibacterota bacterium]|nr:ComEC/Rec2 family competence protein [Candidatus Paceibacterota bacterium]